MKNRVNSFDLYVQLNEQASTTEESAHKMMKSKLKSIAYNASSALSLMEANPGFEVEAYILAQIAVAADYLNNIEECFRGYEGNVEPPMDNVDTPMDAPMDAPMDDTEGEDAPTVDGEEDTPAESNDDEVENEIEEGGDEDGEEQEEE